MIAIADNKDVAPRLNSLKGGLGAWAGVSSHSARIRVCGVIFKRINFYEVWWFYLLCATVLVTLVWMLYKIQANQAKKRFAAVSEERERIAREMHDTVIQGCTGISVLLEALVSTGLGESTEGLQSELLSHAREQVRRTIDEARNAVWNLRSSPEQKIDLVEELYAIARQTRQVQEIDFQVQHNVSHLDIGAAPAHEILMATREAVCNAVRHSGSETIEIDLLNSQEELKISIRDHGCGTEQAQITNNGMHYGIVGIRERMRRLGGGVQIDAAPGMGMTVQLQLNWGNIRKLPARA